MIMSSGELVQILSEQDNQLITVLHEDKEYPIECICHMETQTDPPSTHLGLKIENAITCNMLRE